MKFTFCGNKEAGLFNSEEKASYVGFALISSLERQKYSGNPEDRKLV